MSIIQRVGRRAGRWAIFLFIPALAFVLFLGQPPGHAAESKPGRATDLKFVEGAVKSISGTEIEVGGKSYKITGVPLISASRKTVSPADIPTGSIVTLTFRRGVLTSVRVHPNIVE